jgi:polysaccharide biosynthesis protein PslG
VTTTAKCLMVTLLLTTTLLGCTTSGPQAKPTSRGETSRLQFGISYGDTLPFMANDRLAEALDDAVEIGAGWIRMDLSWADVQPTATQTYTWDRFDRVVTEAHRRRLDVLAVLGYAPGWARVPDCSTDQCAPADPARFATFAGAAAARYAARGVHTWEIWNEENSSKFWGPQADPASYTRLLQASSQAVRAADPKAFVLMGGLAATQTDEGDLSAADFLIQSRESPLQFVDALALHPYTFPYAASRLGPWANPTLRGNSGLPYLRQVLSESGAPNLPIWITEYGAPTGGPGPVWDGSADSLSAETEYHVTESQQAAIAADAIATAASDPTVRSLFWYTDRDFAAPLDDSESYYGLRRVDGSKKPAFTALRDAVKTHAN